MRTFPLGIVTSSSGYGRWLAEWAESIVRQTVRPEATGIFTHGAEEERALGTAAAAILVAAGIPCRHEHEARRLDFGTARNRAVALVGTEWVQHLDADDMLMPHAVEEIARLAPEADVVSLGYERCGDLAAGPRHRRKTYRKHQGAATLRDATPSSGCSPFRRAFWERSPYRTDMTGGWDTALWIGFARLDARFVPTPKPCFWYRQHATSVFNTRRLGGWNAARVGSKLRALRRGYEGVSVVIPWGGEDEIPERRAALAWVRDRYAALHPSWEVVLGTGDPKAWQKGKAVENGLQAARGAVLVLADADCVLPPAALEEAVDLVASGRSGWVVPHGRVLRLSDRQTAEVLGRSPAVDPVVVPKGTLARAPYRGFPGGGVVVVGRSDYEAAGGIPSRFLGWGAEDEALAAILDTLLGPHDRLGADLVHLWHPSARNRGTREQYRANRNLFRAYQVARGNVASMFSLVSGTTRPHLEGRRPGSTPYGQALRQRQLRQRLAEGKTMDYFAERKLAAQAERGKESPMPESFTARRQRAADRRAARASGLPDPGALAPPPGTPQHKAKLDLPSGAPTPPPPQADETEAPKFASATAARLAAEANLPASFWLSLDAGPRGLTTAQVREALAE